MKIKSSVTLTIIICFILLIGTLVMGWYFRPKNDMWNIYCIALDSAMNLDKGLNGNMEYIAIDSNSLKEMKQKDKDRIFMYFKDKYKVDVIETTYQQLKKDGKVNDDTTLDGVLLSIKNTKVSFFNVCVESSKYRAGNGAIGVTSIITYFGQGKWKLTDSGIMWVS